MKILSNNERFIVQESNTPEWYLITDKVNLVSLKFKIHDFNNSQQVIFLENSNLNVIQAARIMREMADYMFANHYDLIF